MDKRLVDAICRQIAQKFPEFAGVNPKVQSQDPASSGNYLLTFKSRGTTANGKAIERIVHVVANSAGKVIKMTTSR